MDIPTTSDTLIAVVMPTEYIVMPSFWAAWAAAKVVAASLDGPSVMITAMI